MAKIKLNNAKVDHSNISDYTSLNFFYFMNRKINFKTPMKYFGDGLLLDMTKRQFKNLAQSFNVREMMEADEVFSPARARQLPHRGNRRPGGLRDHASS